MGEYLMNMLDFPAVVLLLIMALGAYVLWQTQSSPHNDFDFSDMLRDDGGRPSSARMAVFVCLAISSWAVMYMLIHSKGQIDTWVFLGYCGIWSGAKIVEKAIDAYREVKTGGPVVPEPDGQPK